MLSWLAPRRRREVALDPAVADGAVVLAPGPARTVTADRWPEYWRNRATIARTILAANANPVHHPEAVARLERIALEAEERLSEL